MGYGRKRVKESREGKGVKEDIERRENLAKGSKGMSNEE